MNYLRQLWKNKRKKFIGSAVGLIATALVIGISQGLVFAGKPSRPAPQISPIHPDIPLLDQEGNPVMESGEPLSTMRSCGECHDTQFISRHSYHSSLGLNDLSAPGESPSGRAWDVSPGIFGRWQPILYRYLSPAGDERIDLSTPEWVMTFGGWHVGGGPAVTSRDGTPLTELKPDPTNPETSRFDPETGEMTAWDWNASGVVEMNCFLCHTPNPDNQARTAYLQAGKFAWANTATLLGSGVVAEKDGELVYQNNAFQEDGTVPAELVQIQDPTNENCGLCHGLVHDDVEDPLIVVGCSADRWSTITTGQIVSPQKLSDTGMNLANKEELDRPWDVHAERGLNCTDCHYSLNNPLYFQESDQTQPGYLTFDPRRLEIGEYLEKPLHQFARGESAQGTVAPELKDTMRRCDSCHSIENTHDWLPYKEAHVETLSCETCHIPRLYSSANMQQDWTVIQPDGTSRRDCRGVEGSAETVRSLLIGYEPVLLQQRDMDGTTTLSPHNLITSWFWVYDDPPRPVRLEDLKEAYFENGDYHPGILLRFDADGNNALETDELIIDTPEKQNFVKERLVQVGLSNPRITAEIQPFSINHDVIGGDWAIQDCADCHSGQSRVSQSIQLASYIPGGVMPEFVKDTNLALEGEMYQDENGGLYYQPRSSDSGLYVFGHDAVRWIDLGGTFLFIGVLLGITAHGGLRFTSSLRRKPALKETRKVYMYGVYERLWHWLQTFTIVLLLLTGLIIHEPDLFSAFSFRGVVFIHNVLAAILVINAALSLFYHLASGKIQQYIPRPKGFFDRAFSQAIYYLKGIFQNEPHPFEKTVEKKLNPLQKITYVGILNILLPLQIITGVLMWGVQRWPDLAGKLGGLPFLAPFHTLVAWLFASFIVMHVYLTTTGHTPLASIKAMIDGWDELEIHPSPKEGNNHDH